MRWYLPLTCLSPWRHYITLFDVAEEMTTWVLGIKKTSSEAGALLFPVDFYLARQATFLILIDIFKCFLLLCVISYKWFSFPSFFKIYFFSVRDPIREPVYDSIQSDPNFVDAEKRTILR